MIGTMAPTSMVGSSMTMPIMANGVMGQGAYMGMFSNLFTGFQFCTKI